MIKKEIVNDGIENLYYFGYFNSDTSYSDNTSLALRKFRKGATDYVEVWASLIQQYPIDFDILIRMLRSTELLSNNNKQEDYMCNCLLQRSSSRYCYRLIKRINPCVIKEENKDFDRQNKILKSIYTIDKQIDLNDKRVLIFDDIFESEDSMITLAKLLKEQYPKVKVDGYCLCKNYNWQMNQNSNSLDSYFDIMPEYDNNYPSISNFINRGFINKRSFFPQKWSMEAFTSRQGTSYSRIMLIESNEMFLINTMNLVEGLKHTQFINITEGSYDMLHLEIKCEVTRLGCYEGKLYLVPDLYEKQYLSAVHFGTYEYLSTLNS